MLIYLKEAKEQVKQISFCLLKHCFAKIQLIIGHAMSAVTAGELIQVIIQIFT